MSAGELASGNGNVMNKLTIHPLAERFPDIPLKEFEELKKSIQEVGLLEPIVINDKGQILDGRNRYRACVELGIDRPKTVLFGSMLGQQILDWRQRSRDFAEPGIGPRMTEERYIYDANVHRRHLTDDQRVQLATEFAPLFREEAEESKKRKPVDKSVNLNSDSQIRDTQVMNANSTVGKIAAEAGVSRHKAAQALKVAKDPILAKEVANGSKSLVEAVKEIRFRAVPPSVERTLCESDRKRAEELRAQQYRATTTEQFDQAFLFFAPFANVPETFAADIVEHIDPKQITTDCSEKNLTELKLSPIGGIPESQLRPIAHRQPDQTPQPRIHANCRNKAQSTPPSRKGLILTSESLPA